MDGFLVPTLSVQPIVENAVKHGIRAQLKGGTTKIATKEDEKHFIMQITDDGAGFDPQAKKEDGKSHVVNLSKQYIINYLESLEK